MQGRGRTTLSTLRIVLFLPHSWSKNWPSLSSVQLFSSKFWTCAFQIWTRRLSILCDDSRRFPGAGRLVTAGKAFCVRCIYPETNFLFLELGASQRVGSRFVYNYNAGFNVAVELIGIQVFWNIIPRRFVNSNGSSEGQCCLIFWTNKSKNIAKSKIITLKSSKNTTLMDPTSCTNSRNGQQIIIW
jgi:hypothetical protein